jgi:hypothetical protein
MSQINTVRYRYYDSIFGFIPADERNQAQSEYFVAHAFDRLFSKDLRRAVRQAFEPELVPYFADEEIRPQHILIKVARRIYTTRFGVYDLSEYSPNVYLELGIAFGVNKRVIPIVHRDAETQIPSWLAGLNVVRYDNYHSDLPQVLKQVNADFSKGLGESTSATDYPCHFCNQWCSARAIQEPSPYYLVLDWTRDRRGDVDFGRAVERGLRDTGFAVRYIDSQITAGWQICQLAAEISNTQFTVCRIGPNTDPLVFFGFGASLGFRRPPVLLASKQTNPAEIAASLRGWDCHLYNSYQDAEDYLRDQAGALLDEVKSAEMPKHYWQFGEFKVGVLRDISDMLRRDMTFEDRMQGVLILALYALRADAGSLMLISRDRSRLEIAALVSPEITLMDVKNWRAFRLGEGIAGRAAKLNQPYRTSNVHDDPHYLRTTFNPQLRSLVSVPIAHEGQVVGVLNGDNDHEDYFREDDMDFLAEVTRLLAPVIHREYILAPFTHPVAEEVDDTTVHKHLFRDPVCLKCGRENRLRFVRIKDEKGLRYRLRIVCDNCGTDDLLRTYTL